MKEEEEEENNSIDLQFTSLTQTKRKFESAEDHYNQRPQGSSVRRKESKIFKLRVLNNWIKSVLIAKYTRKGNSVLDLCCGKGGDLNKWNNQRIKYLLGLDIAENSIEHAKERFNKQGKKFFKAEFHKCDCFTSKVLDFIAEGTKFDVVSIQFALHYGYESEEKLKTFIKNVSFSLNIGGVLIGTMPNSVYLTSRLENVENDGLEFGNEIYNIRFEERSFKEKTFGVKYYFQLEDAIDDCLEYLADFQLLVELAEKYGMKVEFKQPFPTFVKNEIDVGKNRELAVRMGLHPPTKDGGDIRKIVSLEEWDVVQCYLCFAFKKYKDVQV